MKTPITSKKKDHEIQKFFKKVFKLIIFHDFIKKSLIRLEGPNFRIRLEVS